MPVRAPGLVGVPLPVQQDLQPARLRLADWAGPGLKSIQERLMVQNDSVQDGVQRRDIHRSAHVRVQ